MGTVRWVSSDERLNEICEGLTIPVLRVNLQPDMSIVDVMDIEIEIDEAEECREQLEKLSLDES